MPRTHTLIGVLCLCLCSLAGCDDPASGRSSAVGCQGDKCDDADATSTTKRCKIKDLSGRGRPDQVTSNDDPIARDILDEEGECATTVDAIVTTLLKRCDEVESALISERALLMEGFQDHRSVTQLDCGDSQVFLHFPIYADELEDESPSGMGAYLGEVRPAIMAEDAETGVFNFYHPTSSDFRFFGNSIDMLEGTDLATLADVDGTSAKMDASLNVERSCAGCHPGGGLVMKEQSSPWVHWDAPAASLPDAAEIIDAADPIMGRQSDALHLESAVREGNRAVVAARIDATLERLQDGSATIGDLLEPVLCAKEFNIGSGSRQEVDRLPLDHAVHDGGGGLSRIFVDPDDYRAVLGLRGSRIGDDEHEPRKTTRETVGGLTYVRRAAIDYEYDEQIAEIVGHDLVDDIRAIDFTRSVFSKERCELLEMLNFIDPKVLAEPDPPVALTAAIVDALTEGEAQGLLSPSQANFLARLQQPGSTLAADLEGFAKHCADRIDVADYMAYIGEVRKVAADAAAGVERGNASFVHFGLPGVQGWAMPTDLEERRKGLRFDPNTCELTTAYVPR